MVFWLLRVARLSKAIWKNLVSYSELNLNNLRHFSVRGSVRCISYFSFMITSWNENIFRVAGHLCEESTGHRLIPSTKASDVELWRFRWSTSEINGWVINREVSDYGRHRAYHYVIVMFNLNRIVWQAGQDNASKPYLGALFVCLLSELPAVVLLLTGNY